MSYYNTTNESGGQLTIFQQKAENQNQTIIGIFQRMRCDLTPSQVMRFWAQYTRLTPPPLTSIRRALTTLEKSGQLEKTNTKDVGLYGRREHYWKLK